MGQQLHGQARTTHLMRAEIKASTLSQAALARLYHVSRHTIAKWQAKDSVEDGSHRPKRMNKTMTDCQEEIVLEIRNLIELPVDDLLRITNEFINAKVSRPALLRCLKRHRVPSLRTLRKRAAAITAEPTKTFKDYEPGFVHIDIKYLPKMPDEASRKYLFVAIDRATRWVFLHLYDTQSAENAVDFLDKVKEAAPFTIEKILTDNGVQFTDRFTAKEKEPTGEHVFDKACEKEQIEHRLIPPRHPQTNGMVERFNGRISEVVGQTRFHSAAELAATLLNYMTIYNNHIPQRALNNKTPTETMKIWQENKPNLFIKSVYDHTSPDT